MEIRVPELDKKPGFYYAVTDEGLELPVIDLTNPSFDPPGDLSGLATLPDKHLKEVLRYQKRPSWLTQFFLWLNRNRSIFLRGFMSIRKRGFLDSTTTYLLKIGPENLGKAYCSPIDYRIAGSLASSAVRLRLRDMARLLSQALSPLLTQQPDKPLCFLNIGGGPCPDSWNALLMLRKALPPGALQRPIRIHSLDLHPEGCRFGQRALVALQASGGPLEGLDLQMKHRDYDWRKPEGLSELLGSFGKDALVAVSSEGALLDYGTDEDVLGNLRALKAVSRPDLFFVGSATRKSPYNQNQMQADLHPRTPGEVAVLAAQSGWTVRETLDTPFSFDVLLR